MLRIRSGFLYVKDIRELVNKINGGSLRRRKSFDRSWTRPRDQPAKTGMKQEKGGRTTDKTARTPSRHHTEGLTWWKGPGTFLSKQE